MCKVHWRCRDIIDAIVLESFLNFLQCLCCWGNFFCFDILRACHTWWMTLRIRHFWVSCLLYASLHFSLGIFKSFSANLSMEEGKKTAIVHMGVLVVINHCTPAGNDEFLKDSHYLMLNENVLWIKFHGVPNGLQVFFTF